MLIVARKNHMRREYFLVGDEQRRTKEDRKWLGWGKFSFSLKVFSILSSRKRKSAETADQPKDGAAILSSGEELGASLDRQ
jgi:hypothetical protein